MFHRPDSAALIAVPFAILDLTHDRLTAANEAARRLLGLQSLPHPFSQHLGNALPRFLVFLDEVSHRGSAWTRDIAVTDRAGRALRLEIRASLDPAAPGLLSMILLDLDELDERAEATEAQRNFRHGLSEWKRAQTFFSELERQNQLILNAAGEGIYGVNAEGKTTFVNRAAQEMLGWTAADLLGRDIHSMIHHHHLDGRT